jgi:flagellar biosynthesis/type III secretory pathway protein FliH
MSDIPPKQLIKLFHDYGYRDFLYRRGQCFEEYFKYEENEENRKTAYEQGYRGAEAEMQRLGPVKLYLTELLKEMETGDEWYGTSFDEPKQLVQWAIEALKPEQGG